VRVKVIFLPDCALVLSLLKHSDVGVFLNKKMRNPNRGSPLNSSCRGSIWGPGPTGRWFWPKEP